MEKKMKNKKKKGASLGPKWCGGCRFSRIRGVWVHYMRASIDGSLKGWRHVENAFQGVKLFLISASAACR